MEAASSTYPLIGQVVGGRYHIVDLIGEGGMGVVYKAEQRLGSTVRRVAVKTLHAELSRDPSITARFHREVGTVAQLEHPNTVKVYDFGSTDDGTLYIAMEFLDGKALNRVIEKDGALDPKRVGNILRQVAGSLDEAHRQGIIHRDLKPENVLLIERAGEKDVVKLVDFGIAARTESADREKEQKLTQQGMVLGTPPYMSPEQFTGKHLDMRSDVYSLGVMAYEMLTGQLPFQADTPWQWATHHMTSQPRSFDEIPAGGRIPQPLRRAVLKALAKEPSDRQSGAGQFYAEFAAALGMVTSVAPVAPAAPAAGGKTEAMPQATPLGVAATEYMPAAQAMPSPAASPPVALPPAPPREGAAQGRGMIYGLGAAAAAILVAIIVVALKPGGGGEVAPIELTPAAPSAETTPAATTPEVTPSEPTPPDTTEDPEPPAPKPKPSASTPKPATPKPSTTPPTTSTPAPATTPPATTPPVTTPPATSTPPATTTPPVQPPPQLLPAQPTPPAQPAGNACAQCLAAVGSKSYQAAAGHYAQCTDSGQKRACSAKMSQTAVREIGYDAKNGQCAKARATANAARSMGVPDAPLNKALGTCP